MALIISQMISLPVGVISAIRRNTPLDYMARSFAIGLLAVPSFWLALLAIIYGFRWFGWTPPLTYHQLWDDPVANLKTLWLPAIILGGILSGTVMRLTRSTMLEVLRQDYVRTAWAKGLRERVIIIRHCLRNAFIPVITVIGLQVPLLIGGTVVLESIFSIPGMGRFMLDAIQDRDYPVVQGIVLLSATMVVMTNLVVDLTYSLLDPRIRHA
jgi:peptide/nickel transport system permease protein